jgi:Protein of unknown function (DUF3500)
MNGSKRKARRVTQRYEGTARSMRAAALGFLDGLSDDLRAKALRPFSDHSERRSWTYLPGPREGVSFDELPRQSRKAVHRLIAASLQPHAYAQVAVIAALEDVLDDREGGRRGRNSGDYWTIVFGDPSRSDPWAWRFEGHHASLNVTLDGDEVLSATPCFLGANPAAIRYLGLPVVRPLAQEEDMARALLDVLTPAEQEAATVSEEAPSDIVTKTRPLVAAGVEPLGVVAERLRAPAVDALRRLVEVYLDRVPEEAARRRSDVLQDDSFLRVAFAWAGSQERGRPHYYRVQGPNLLIEYDNTQNNANHVHSVWRDPEGDFGNDVLARHFEHHHSI